MIRMNQGGSVLGASSAGRRSADMQKEQSAGSNTPFDDAFKTLQERAPFLLLPVLNEVFGTAYDIDSENLIQKNGEHHTRKGRLYEDSRFTVSGEVFHLECESTQNGAISLRLVEYDFADALKDAYVQRKYKGKNDLRFSRSCILQLRGQEGRSRYDLVNIHIPDHEILQIKIPIIHVLSYSLDKILEKKLFFFLPFYFLRYEKQFRKPANKEVLMETIERDFQTLETGMREYFVGTKWEYCYALINDLIKTVLYAIIPAEDSDLKERMDSIMGGHSISTPTTIWIDRGIEIGRQQVIQQERAKTERERAKTERERAKTEQQRRRAEEALKELAVLKEKLAKYEMQ